MPTIHTWRFACTAVAIGFAALIPARAFAHCDGLDGPVVKAAQLALDTRNPALALMWVSETDEREIRAAFEQTLAVRALSPQAKELADRYFFETLVRLHRAGEGASFTGLKPAGRDLGPAIPAADEAVRSGSLEPVLRLLTAAMQRRLREGFAPVTSSKVFDARDVAAGRAHVQAYVEFIHLVEQLYDATMHPAKGHLDESDMRAKDR
ncbi:MAG TPA: DUF6448 family protein [Vicinamibacterales bacterium]|nr:DUF6448 family protein [Vicinamibacterales bacterium]